MKIIIIYINKIKRLENFIIFFNTFGLCKLKEAKSNIDLIVNKFWEFFNLEKKNGNLDAKKNIYIYIFIMQKK